MYHYEMSVDTLKNVSFIVYHSTIYTLFFLITHKEIIQWKLKAWIFKKIRERYFSNIKLVKKILKNQYLL